MIDHVYLPVTDLERSREFYRAVLATLDIAEGFTRNDSVVFGVGEPGALWIYPVGGRTGMERDPCGTDPIVTGSLPRLHVAFTAASRGQVQDFHDAAVGMGAEVLGSPGLFLVYHDMYFASFIQDPDGHNIKAVTISAS